MKGKNWEVRPLGEIITLNYGKALEPEYRSPSGAYPVYGANGIKDWSDRYLSKGPSIIIGRKGSAGEIALAEGDFWPLDVTYFVSFDSSLYDLKFLYYLLSDQRLPSLARGVKPGINRNDVYALKVAVPPLEEQKRIVAILDEAFEGLARARENAEANLQSTEKLYQHFVISRFSRPEGSWKCGPLEQLAGPIYTGPFGSILHKSDYVSGGIPLINPAHIVAGRIVPDEEKTVSEETCERLRSYRLNTNDVVIGRRGEMGRCAVVTKRECGWLCGTGSFFLRPLEGVSGAFVSLMLQSSYYRKRIEEIATGTTMLNLSNTALGSLSVSVPSYSKQLSLVSEFDEFRQECARLADVANATVQKLDDLRQSLLHKAFSGQLT